HPTNGLLYAIMREVGSTTVRKLASINPNTGAATIIGVLGDNFAALAFRSDGVLFALTGAGATVPATLYTVNITNALKTVVMTLARSSAGESMTLGDDGFLYRFSGCCTPNVDTFMEKIDTTTFTSTNIPLSGFAYFELLGSTSWVGGNLLCSDLNDRL